MASIKLNTEIPYVDSKFHSPEISYLIYKTKIPMVNLLEQNFLKHLHSTEQVKSINLTNYLTEFKLNSGGLLPQVHQLITKLATYPHLMPRL
jgi:hypothetical protein